MYKIFIISGNIKFNIHGIHVHNSCKLSEKRAPNSKSEKERDLTKKSSIKLKLILERVVMMDGSGQKVAMLTPSPQSCVVFGQDRDRTRERGMGAIQKMQMGKVKSLRDSMEGIPVGRSVFGCIVSWSTVLGRADLSWC